MTNKGPIGIIGINSANVDRLKAGMALDVDLSEITPPGLNLKLLVIHYAPTYRDVVEDMKQGGLPISDDMFEIAKDLDDQLERERYAKTKVPKAKGS